MTFFSDNGYNTLPKHVDVASTLTLVMACFLSPTIRKQPDSTPLNEEGYGVVVPNQGTHNIHSPPPTKI